MSMKSYKMWQSLRTLNEFAGPMGQVDPLGSAPGSVRSPLNPAGAARPGMAANAGYGQQQQQQPAQEMTPDNPALQPDQQQQPEQMEPGDQLPQAYQILLKSLGNKSPKMIMQIRDNFNAAVQQLLANKGNGAGRMGVTSGLVQARNARMNFGKPPAMG